MKTKHYFLIFWLGVAFSGIFCLNLSAQKRIVIVNECDEYPDNINRFFRNMEKKTGGIRFDDLVMPTSTR